MTREEKLQEIKSTPQLIAAANAQFDAEEQQAKDQAAYEVEAARKEFSAREKAINDQLAIRLKEIADNRASRLSGIEARRKSLVSHTPPSEELSSSSVVSPITTSDNENKSKSGKGKRPAARHLRG